MDEAKPKALAADRKAREAAKAAGQTRYCGRECPKGHGTVRFVSNANCIVCTRHRVTKHRRKLAQQVAEAVATADVAPGPHVPTEGQIALACLAREELMDMIKDGTFKLRAKDPPPQAASETKDSVHVGETVYRNQPLLPFEALPSLRRHGVNA